MQSWHAALNAGDVEHLVALSTEDVEVGGPRGSGRGSQLLREWFGRAGIRLVPRQVFQRGNVVIVEQDAEWRSPETGEITGKQALASVFIVRKGLVASVVRHADLASALSAAGLSEDDAV